MNTPQHFTSIQSEQDFHTLALETFRFQHHSVPVYRRFCDLLQVEADTVKRLEDIPFLPIQFFKSERVLVSERTSQKVFTSSGTTGNVTSKHFVADIALYEQSFYKAFQHFYGSVSDYTILALLPSYLERGGSSLVYMVDALIKASGNSDSGFFLNDLDALIATLKALEAKKQNTLLLGVSYALLDVLEKESFQLKHTTVMETGGMKGRRKEMVKPELHQKLSHGFGVSKIHSEYGMTELLSQAYSKGGGRFHCPPWMKILTRDTEDAFGYVREKTGGINVIDLANINSCSFIATQDLGRVYADSTFEVIGRFDNSDIRGCNLMVL